MNSATINTIHAMLIQLTPKQISEIEILVADHYRTNLIERIKSFENADLLQVGSFVGSGEVFSANSADYDPDVAAAAASGQMPRDMEQLFEFMSYDKLVEH